MCTCIFRAEVKLNNFLLRGCSSKKFQHKTDSPPLSSVLLILTGVGLALLGIGLVGYLGSFSHFSQITTILVMAAGSACTLIAAIFAALARNPTIILTNQGMQVVTSVNELYKFAQDYECLQQDKEKFLADVKEVLNERIFQAGADEYIKYWFENREWDNQVQNEALSFFCTMLGEVDNPNWPWQNHPTPTSNLMIQQLPTSV